MIDAFIEYLNSNTSGFKRITHAKDQQPVDELEAELPLLGVFPGDDSTRSNEDRTDYIESKMIESCILVHLVCEVEAFEDLRKSLRSAAIGWCASEHHTDLTLMSGKVLQLKGGVIWWQDLYSSRHLIRESY